jgi:hypothetical protein
LCSGAQDNRAVRRARASRFDDDLEACLEWLRVYDPEWRETIARVVRPAIERSVGD